MFFLLNPTLNRTTLTHTIPLAQAFRPEAFPCHSAILLSPAFALGFFFRYASRPMNLRVPHPRFVRVGFYAPAPRTFSSPFLGFSCLCSGCFPKRAPLPRPTEIRHPERSGPIFSDAPYSGASGRAVEESWQPTSVFRFSANSVSSALTLFLPFPVTSVLFPLRTLC